MRVLLLSVLMILGVAVFPAGVNAGCNCGGATPGNFSSYCGPACFGPPGFCLTPGCCECPPTACDNAWDGYCERKAQWQAFWTRVGTGQASRHNHCWEVVMPAEGECPATSSEVVPEKPLPMPELPSSPEVKPATPSPPVPAPLPLRSTRRVYFPWSR